MFSTTFVKNLTENSDVFLQQFARVVREFGFAEIRDAHVLFPVDVFGVGSHGLAELVVDRLVQTTEVDVRLLHVFGHRPGPEKDSDYRRSITTIFPSIRMAPAL